MRTITSSQKNISGRNSATLDARIRKQISKAVPDPAKLNKPVPFPSKANKKKGKLSRPKKKRNSRRDISFSYSEDSSSDSSYDIHSSYSEHSRKRNTRRKDRSSRGNDDYSNNDDDERDDYSTGGSESESCSDSSGSYSTDTEVNSVSKLIDKGLVFNASDLSECWSKVDIHSDEEEAFQKFTDKFEAKKGIFYFGAEDDLSLPSIDTRPSMMAQSSKTRSSYTQSLYGEASSCHSSYTRGHSFDATTVTSAVDGSFSVKSCYSEGSDDESSGIVERVDTFKTDQTDQLQEANNGWMCGLDDDSIAEGSYGGLRNDEILVAVSGTMKNAGTINTYETMQSCRKSRTFDPMEKVREEESDCEQEEQNEIRETSPIKQVEEKKEDPAVNEESQMAMNEESLGEMSSIFPSIFSLNYWGYGSSAPETETPNQQEAEQKDEEEKEREETIETARRDLLVARNLVVESNTCGADGQMVNLNARVRKTVTRKETSKDSPTMKVHLDGRVKHFYENKSGAGDTLNGRDTLNASADNNAFVVDESAYHARPAPKRTPPKIPVRQRKPIKPKANKSAFIVNESSTENTKVNNNAFIVHDSSTTARASNNTFIANSSTTLKRYSPKQSDTPEFPAEKKSVIGSNAKARHTRAVVNKKGKKTFATKAKRVPVHSNGSVKRFSQPDDGSHKNFDASKDSNGENEFFSNMKPVAQNAFVAKQAVPQKKPNAAKASVPPAPQVKANKVVANPGVARTNPNDAKASVSTLPQEKAKLVVVDAEKEFLKSSTSRQEQKNMQLQKNQTKSFHSRSSPMDNVVFDSVWSASTSVAQSSVDSFSEHDRQLEWPKSIKSLIATYEKGSNGLQQDLEKTKDGKSIASSYERHSTEKQDEASTHEDWNFSIHSKFVDADCDISCASSSVHIDLDIVRCDSIATETGEESAVVADTNMYAHYYSSNKSKSDTDDYSRHDASVSTKQSLHSNHWFLGGTEQEPVQPPSDRQLASNGFDCFGNVSSENLQPSSIREPPITATTRHHRADRHLQRLLVESSASTGRSSAISLGTREDSTIYSGSTERQQERTFHSCGGSSVSSGMFGDTLDRIDSLGFPENSEIEEMIKDIVSKKNANGSQGSVATAFDAWGFEERTLN